MAKGSVVQRGTHETLLRDTSGEYARLVHAQKISRSIEKSSRDEVDEKATLGKNEGITVEEDSCATTEESDVTTAEAESETSRSKHESIFRSLFILLSEQKQNPWGYVVMLLAAMGAAGSYSPPTQNFTSLTTRLASNPIQAYLFARLISSFAYWGEWLRVTNTFLCLMLLAVAGGIGLSYFTLGWVSNTVSIVSNK